jgi:hypothetical protein
LDFTSFADRPSIEEGRKVMMPGLVSKSEGQSPLIEFKKKQRGVMVIQLDNEEEEKMPDAGTILFNG